jgi:hypothetical protein
MEKKKKGRKAAAAASGGSSASWQVAPPWDANPGGCFQAGTQIPLKEGTKSIENIKVGDKVVSKNLKTDVVETAVVWGLSTHESNKDGLIINGFIKTTTNHPFYLEGKWVTAGELELGDKILHLDGELHTINSLELDDTPYTVYNFEVDNTHTYYAEGYLVHNASKRPEPVDDDTPTPKSQENGGPPSNKSNPPAGQVAPAITPTAANEWVEYKKNAFGMAAPNLGGSSSLSSKRPNKVAKILVPSRQEPAAEVDKKSAPVVKK